MPRPGFFRPGSQLSSAPFHAALRPGREAQRFPSPLPLPPRFAPPLHDALQHTNAALAQWLLGGPKFTTSRRAPLRSPHVTLGEARIADFSTGTEPGEEHQLTLHAWSRQGGQREAHAIAGALLAGA